MGWRVWIGGESANVSEKVDYSRCFAIWLTVRNRLTNRKRDNR